MRWVIWLGAAVVALLGLAAVAAGVAPGLLKPRAEAAASRALGREVTIAGLSLRPAWPPELVASGVRADGLGTLGSATAHLDPSSLLTVMPLVTTLVLVHPDLTLASGPDGLPVLNPIRKTPARTAAPGNPRAVAARHPAGATVERIVIEGGRIVWTDFRTAQPIRVTVSGTVDLVSHAVSLRFETPAQDSYPAMTGSLHAAFGLRTQGDIAFAVQGKPVHVRIDATIPETFPPAQPVGLSLRAEAPGAMLTAKGSVTAKQFDLAVAMRAADEASLASLFGHALATTGPVQFAVQAHGDAAHVALNGLALESPQGDLSGDIAVTLGPRATLTGALASSRFDLDSLIAALPHSPLSAPARPGAAAPPPAQNGTVIPDRTLPFASLGRADADIRLSAAILHVAGIDYPGLAGHLVLQNGHLALDPFAAVLPGGAHLQAGVRLDAAAAPPTASLVLHAPSVDVAPLLSALHLPSVMSGTGSLDADLHGAGATAHALAASLDGTAELRLQNGTIETGLFSPLFHAARLPVALPHGQARLQCLAVGAAAHAGVAGLAPLVADADRLRIDGGGTVDLGHETLALNLRPLLRTGLGLIVPVQVTGSWRAPKVAVGAENLGRLPSQDTTACPPASPTPASIGGGSGKKLPKPIDILRGLLR